MLELCQFGGFNLATAELAVGKFKDKKDETKYSQFIQTLPSHAY